MARICVIDDQALIRESLSAALVRQDHDVEVSPDAASMLDELASGKFDLLITDLKMPGMDGVSLLREIRRRGCDTPVIVMTAYGTVGTAVEAMKLGAFDYIQKPFEAQIIAVQVDRALSHGRLVRENEAYRRSIDDLHSRRELVGDSKLMVDLRRRVAQVAQSSATVLIRGESGTGKELIAWAVHEASSRADQPMLCVNCAALSASLLESELFGHERGAFTGADRTRKGRFELADGGTLLLDEISEMALPLQAKLLRVLQEGEFERVGSSTTRRANVRVIATTNRDLNEWVARKRFREDLYYRLNVLPLEVPPLRNRLEDVAPLVDFFTKRIAQLEGRKAVNFEPDALKMLQQYSWPGNVRELENLCQRATALAEGRWVQKQLVQDWIQPANQSVELLGKLRHGRMLEDMERQLIERALAEHNGHRERTAKALGMGVRTLGMRLKQWREEEAAAQRHRAVARNP